MKTKFVWIALTVATISITTWAVKHLTAPKPLAIIDPHNESDVDATAVEKGLTYKLWHADLYRVNTSTGKWEMIEHAYDPDFYAKNYVEKDGAIFRKRDNGELIPVRRQLSEDFEKIKTLRELGTMESGWTEFTLQSPKTPTVKDFVALRNRIIRGQSDFIDNRIEFVSDMVHSGHGAMKTYCESPSRSMICAKSFLGTELLHFVKGDEVWLSGWFNIPKGSGVPFTVFDLKTNWIHLRPGIRLVLWDGKYAGYELKWARRVEYRQAHGKESPFPLGQWVNLKVHLKLSEKDADGLIEMWQDGQQILNTHGQTLTMANSVYNSLEVGITAHNDLSKPATLYVDDVKVSSNPL